MTDLVGTTAEKDQGAITELAERLTAFWVRLLRG
jgi:hypothetical protein